MDKMTGDNLFMEAALAEAQHALSLGEVPVGAVIVRDGQVIAAGHNSREKNKNAVCHAEIEAISAACKALGSWRLSGCSLYVTLEPCPMCAGAIINARIDRVVYGAADEKAGCAGSVINLFALDFNHRPKITSGVLKDRCLSVLQEFFKELRK